MMDRKEFLLRLGAFVGMVGVAPHVIFQPPVPEPVDFGPLLKDLNNGTLEFFDGPGNLLCSVDLQSGLWQGDVIKSGTVEKATVTTPDRTVTVEIDCHLDNYHVASGQIVTLTSFHMHHV